MLSLPGCELTQLNLELLENHFDFMDEKLLILLFVSLHLFVWEVSYFEEKKRKNILEIVRKKSVREKERIKNTG